MKSNFDITIRKKRSTGNSDRYVEDRRWWSRSTCRAWARGARARECVRGAPDPCRSQSFGESEGTSSNWKTQRSLSPREWRSLPNLRVWGWTWLPWAYLSASKTPGVETWVVADRDSWCNRARSSRAFSWARRARTISGTPETPRLGPSGRRYTASHSREPRQTFRYSFCSRSDPPSNKNTNKSKTQQRKKGKKKNKYKEQNRNQLKGAKPKDTYGRVRSKTKRFCKPRSKRETGFGQDPHSERWGSSYKESDAEGWRKQLVEWLGDWIRP